MFLYWNIKHIELHHLYVEPFYRTASIMSIKVGIVDVRQDDQNGDWKKQSQFCEYLLLKITKCVNKLYIYYL